MTRLIIVTTAVNRPPIHNISFPSYLRFLNGRIPLQWLINIDQVACYPSSGEQVKANLEKLLVHYSCTYWVNKRGHFYRAVHRLIQQLTSMLSDDIVVLWLEDDWVLNKETTIDCYLPLVKSNTILSLVYNMIGSFPPFLMGYHIAQLFCQDFLIKCISNVDPEKISRKIMKNLCCIYGCIYYTYFSSCTPIDSNETNTGLFYTENNFKIEDCRILTHSQTSFKNMINQTVDSYLKEDTSKIIFIRLNLRKDHIRYVNSVFRDLGRIYKRELV